MADEKQVHYPLQLWLKSFEDDHGRSFRGCPFWENRIMSYRCLTRIRRLAGKLIQKCLGLSVLCISYSGRTPVLFGFFVIHSAQEDWLAFGFVL